MTEATRPGVDMTRVMPSRWPHHQCSVGCKEGCAACSSGGALASMEPRWDQGPAAHLSLPQCLGHGAHRVWLNKTVNKWIHGRKGHCTEPDKTWWWRRRGDLSHLYGQSMYRVGEGKRKSRAEGTSETSNQVIPTGHILGRRKLQGSLRCWAQALGY